MPGLDDRVPELAFIGGQDPSPVLRTKTTTVFEMAGTRPYASAEGCRVETASQDHMVAHCDHASRLLRLEVFMKGWQARVNGLSVEIVPVEQTFQGVDLPAGSTVIDFTYAPAGLRPSVLVALATLVGIVGLCMAPRLTRNSTVRDDSGGASRQ
jgi:hypothetical protein